jgi:membrane-associated phospholipid phosphatase
MTTDPDPLPQPPGWPALLGVPLLAAGGAAAVLAADANASLFLAVNAWPLATGDAPWASLTVLGEGAAMLALSALLIGRRPALLWTVVLASLLVTATLHPLKDLLDVARPAHVLGAGSIHVVGETLTRRSFPSGHAATAFAAAALLLPLRRATWSRALVLALASLVALSRLAVGAHWPLDVLAGAALGWLCGGAALHLAQRSRWGLGPRARLAVAALPLLGTAHLVWPDDGAGLLPVHWILVAVGFAAGLDGWRRLLRPEDDAVRPRTLAP